MKWTELLPGDWYISPHSMNFVKAFVVSSPKSVGGSFLYYSWTVYGLKKFSSRYCIQSVHAGYSEMTNAIVFRNGKIIYPS